MSWHPVTRWALRCDGRVPFGQCPNLLRYDPDGEDADNLGERPSAAEREERWSPALWTAEELAVVELTEWRDEGWLVLPDGRVLCPEHTAAAERMAWAALDGLPFSDTHLSGGETTEGQR